MKFYDFLKSKSQISLLFKIVKLNFLAVYSQKIIFLTV